MNETHLQPAGHQRCLALNHRGQQFKIRIGSAGKFRIVPPDHEIRQDPDRLGVAARGKILKRTHAHVTRRRPRQDGTGYRTFAEHRLTGDDGCEATR